MKLLITYIALRAFTTSLIAAQSDPHFMIATHPIAITHLNSQSQSNEIQKVVFKLDTEIGSVWRLGTNGFVRILVRDLVSQKAFAERQNEEVCKRLRAITIPELNFHNETISNALVFLQKQIRERDPMIEAGSDHFLRLKLVGVPGDPFALSASPITFQAKDVSAWDALKTITDVASFKIRIVDGGVVVSPLLGDGDDLIETSVYEVSPSLRDRMKGSSITNIFTKLGFNLNVGAGMIYSPELDTIVLCETVQKQQQFAGLLFEAGLARLCPDRFRLISASAQREPILFLLDDKTGETWNYRHLVTSDGTVSESFNLIRTDL
jgi:hypothetical protein